MNLSFSIIGVSAIITFVNVLTGCQQINSKAEPINFSVRFRRRVCPCKRNSVNKKDRAFPAKLIPLERAEIFAKVSGYSVVLKVEQFVIKLKRRVLRPSLEAPEMITNYAEANADVQWASFKIPGLS